MKFSYVVSAALALHLSACNQQAAKDDGTSSGEKSPNENGDTNDLVIEESVPEDSTGAQAPVALDIQTSRSAGMSLQDEETETPAADESTDTPAPADQAPEEKSIKVSDSVTLNMARFNLWAVKVKAQKDPSEKEKELEKRENEEEGNDVAELESETAAGLKEDDDKDGKDPKNELQKAEHDSEKMREKIKEKREEYKEREEKHKERDKARDKSLKFHGPYIYDAIAGAMEGDAPAVDLNDGSYRRIEFKLKRNVTAEDTDPILGNVFVIRGTVMKGEESVPFEITWHSAMNFRLRGEKAFKVEAEGESKLAIVFDVTKWFDGIDMTAATAADDGMIYINKKSNKDILKQLRKNIKMNTRFGKDKDGNGKLDESETSGQGEDTADAE
jgi:hypothetical protein